MSVRFVSRAVSAEAGVRNIVSTILWCKLSTEPNELDSFSMPETYSSVMLVRDGELGAADGGGEQDCLRSPPETFFMMNTNADVN